MWRYEGYESEKSRSDLGGQGWRGNRSTIGGVPAARWCGFSGRFCRNGAGLMCRYEGYESEKNTSHLGGQGWRGDTSKSVVIGSFRHFGGRSRKVEVQAPE